MLFHFWGNNQTGWVCTIVGTLVLYCMYSCCRSFLVWAKEWAFLVWATPWSYACRLPQYPGQLSSLFSNRLPHFLSQKFVLVLPFLSLALDPSVCIALPLHYSVFSLQPHCPCSGATLSRKKGRFRNPYDLLWWQTDSHAHQMVCVARGFHVVAFGTVPKGCPQERPAQENTFVVPLCPIDLVITKWLLNGVFVKFQSDAILNWNGTFVF